MDEMAAILEALAWPALTQVILGPMGPPYQPRPRCSGR